MTTEDRILKAAEDRIRTSGYNGFSFRDIARDTGLTNAGVHHYFATKPCLVGRVAEDYASGFITELRNTPVETRVERLKEMFAQSLRKEGKMCLCGVLAAESGGLPERVVNAARGFFVGLTEQLSACFPGSTDPESEALAILAQLEGAVLIAQAHADPDFFDEATRNLGHRGLFQAAPSVV